MAAPARDPYQGDEAMQDDLLTAEEVADRLRLKHDTIMIWARQGRIPAHRLTRKVIRFRIEDVVAALVGEADRGETRGVAEQHPGA
jgi:excisionase family DNA binding protein